MSRRSPQALRQRVKIADAVAMLGLEARTVRDMAQRGEIPGASKPRGIWTFDRALLEQFNRECEAAACQRAQDAQRLQQGVSGVVTSSTAGFRSPAATSNGLYAQTIQKLRQHAAKPSVTAR